MPLDLDKIDRLVTLSLLLLVPVGLVCALAGAIIRGSDDDRFVLGGLCLAMAAIVGLAAYWQIRTGKAPVRESIWSNRMKWEDNQDRPFRYTFTTIMYVLCSIGLCVLSLLVLIFSSETLGDVD